MAVVRMSMEIAFFKIRVKNFAPLLGVKAVKNHSVSEFGMNNFLVVKIKLVA